MRCPFLQPLRRERGGAVQHHRLAGPLALPRPAVRRVRARLLSLRRAVL
jgi:hypothetical protein